MPRQLNPRAHPNSSTRERALDALALTRRGVSLTRAARLARTDPRTVRKVVGSALHRRGSRWEASAFDRIPREMTVLTPEGPEVRVLRDSRQATAVAKHANAVRAYIERGDDEQLQRLRRKRVRVDGELLELVTDPVRLDRLAAGGDLAYELYRF